MNAIEGLLEAYRVQLQSPWSDALAGSQRVWFAIYDPAQERRLRLRLPDFATLTEQSGHRWLPLDLSDEFARWMAAHEYRDAYFAEPELMSYALEEFHQRLANRVRDELARPDAGPGSVVALSGLISFFGLASLSHLVASVSNVIPGRLLVFFPGDINDQHQYRFLDAHDGWDYLAVPIKARA
jgi:hypothetical protein